MIFPDSSARKYAEDVFDSLFVDGGDEARALCKLVVDYYGYHVRLKRVRENWYRIDFVAPRFTHGPFEYPLAFELARTFYPHIDSPYDDIRTIENKYDYLAFDDEMLYDFVHYTDPEIIPNTIQYLSRKDTWSEEIEDIQQQLERIYEMYTDYDYDDWE